MPVYVYRVVPRKKGATDPSEQTFEVRQSFHDAPLTEHPETGEPVERVILVPSISVGKMGNASLSSAGFTKYKRTSDGTYEKQAGAGPQRVNPREP